jgi:hypothetical protein
LTFQEALVQVRYHCPTDGCVAIIEYEPLEEAPGSITCPRCHTEHPVQVTDAMLGDNRVDLCAVCGCRELFIRKDFPQKLGLAVVLIAGVASIILFKRNFLAAYAVLAAAMAVDFLWYLMIGKVTTCYACRAEYRKGALNPAHQDFDLATSEQY